MAYASVVGTSHLKTETPCQDSGSCRTIMTVDGSAILIAAVSDGAGSARRSETGSALAVESFMRTFGAAAAQGSGLEALDRNFASRWLIEVQETIAAAAQQEQLEARDYACTILGAVISPSAAVFLQIGDGAIVVGDEDPTEYCWIFWPQHGEFANQTFFVTQEHANEVMQFERAEKCVDEVAIFSDGIERLVLDLAAKTVHAPSFRPIFAWLAKQEPSQPYEPSLGLTAYLSSDHINNRTDDDKTLVMATRRQPAAAPEEV